MTVVETLRFLRDADGILADREREELVRYLGTNPEAGALMPGTGGVRKLRWQRSGMGKRGGSRIIYYFHGERWPLFLLAAYGKNERENLTQAERNAMKKLIPILITGYSKSEKE